MLGFFTSVDDLTKQVAIPKRAKTRASRSSLLALAQRTVGGASVRKPFWLRSGR
jgi:hypothetical protein